MDNGSIHNLIAVVCALPVIAGLIFWSFCAAGKNQEKDEHVGYRIINE